MAVSLMQTNLHNHRDMGLSEKDVVNKLTFSFELRKKSVELRNYFISILYILSYYMFIYNIQINIFISILYILLYVYRQHSNDV